MIRRAFLLVVSLSIAAAASAACPTPTAPVLSGPQTVETQEIHTMGWTPWAWGNFTYDFQMASNADFIGAQTMNTTGNSVSFSRHITTSTTYYHRVRVNLYCEGSVLRSPWSNVLAVTVNVADECQVSNWSEPAGEVWVAGGQVAVRWLTTGACSGNVKLELYSDTRVLQTTIAASTPNDRLEIWNIPPSLAAGTYQVKVTDPATGVHAYASAKILAAPTGPVPPRADFNGDAKHDLLWRNKDTGQAWVSTVVSSAVITGFSLFTEPNVAWRIIGSGDFNGDGRGDVLLRNFSTGQVSIKLFNHNTLLGTGYPWTDANPAWSIVDLADFDGDRRTDILWRNSSTGQLFVLLVTGVKVKLSGVVWTEPNLNWDVVAATDMNGDGKADLLLRNSVTGVVFIIYMNGVTVLSKGVFNETRGPEWTLAAAGDIDGDNDSDLIWRHNTTGEVRGTLVNGLNVAGSARIWSESKPAWRIQGMADFDGNGRQDLLWRNTESGLLFLVRLNGLSVIGTRTMYAESKLAWKIVAPTTSAVARDGNVSP